jgi:hypothetical protein
MLNPVTILVLKERTSAQRKPTAEGRCLCDTGFSNTDLILVLRSFLQDNDIGFQPVPPERNPDRVQFGTQTVPTIGTASLSFILECRKEAPPFLNIPSRGKFKKIFENKQAIVLQDLPYDVILPERWLVEHGVIITKLSYRVGKILRRLFPKGFKDHSTGNQEEPVIFQCLAGDGNNLSRVKLPETAKDHEAEKVREENRLKRDAHSDLTTKSGGNLRNKTDNKDSPLRKIQRALKTVGKNQSDKNVQENKGVQESSKKDTQGPS